MIALVSSGQDLCLPCCQGSSPVCVRVCRLSDQMSRINEGALVCERHLLGVFGGRRPYV